MLPTEFENRDAMTFSSLVAWAWREAWWLAIAGILCIIISIAL
jgi:hypothetical protein